MPAINESIFHPGRNRYPVAAVIVCALLLELAGCAKIAEPQPPESLVPQAAADLSAHQRADFVELRVSPPQQNTNGTPVTALQSIEVYRLAGNIAESDLKHPIHADQFRKESVPILSIPGSRLPEYLHENQLLIEDRLSEMEHSFIFEHAFRYAVLFVNKKNQAAGFSNQAVIAPVAIPVPPANISVEVHEASIDLSWTPPAENMDGSAPPRILGYNIYRSAEPESSGKSPLNSVPLQSPQYQDADFHFDTTYYYRVSIVGGLHSTPAESLLSEKLAVTPRDMFPPAPPGKFSAVSENSAVLLVWIPPSSSDVAGYRITRHEEETEDRRQLHEGLITIHSYRDDHVFPGRKYTYTIIAVDAHGNESPAIATEAAMP